MGNLASGAGKSRALLVCFTTAFITSAPAIAQACSPGYVRAEGTQTCFAPAGYLRGQVGFGDYLGRDTDGDGKAEKADAFGIILLGFRSETPTTFGRLYTLVEGEWRKNAAEDWDFDMKQSYFELGRLKVGYAHSTFRNWTDIAGEVRTDGIVRFTPSLTDQIAWTFGDADEGWAAIAAMERGTDGRGDTEAEDFPHVLLGLRHSGERVRASALVAQDSVTDAWAVKGRVDYEFGADTTGFFMAAHANDDSRYRQWAGDWAFWSGFSYDLTKTASFNTQISRDAEGNAGYVANVTFRPTRKIAITPELVRADLGEGPEWGALLRVQRNF